MANKIIIDALVLIKIYWKMIYCSSISVISTVIGINWHRVQKHILWNLISVTTGSMCKQMDMSVGRYIFLLKIW